MSKVHVNQHVIRHNKKYNNALPACRTQQETGASHYSMEVSIVDKRGDEVARLIYRPNDPLKCGAKLWIETKYDAVPIGEIPYSAIAQQMKEIMT